MFPAANVCKCSGLFFYKGVFRLYIEAIKSIKAAEDEARQAKELAQRQAREAVDEAERIGKESVASTLSRAGDEIAHLKHVTDQKAAGQAVELASTTANRRATLRARAERRLDYAARFIVERIVNA